MEQPLQVRWISEADAPSYYALRACSTLGLVHPAESEVLRELGGGHVGLVRLLAQYDMEGIRVWGVFDRGSLIGALGLSRSLSLWQPDAGFLWGMFVLPRYRGTGVSRLLVEAALDWCEQEVRIHDVSVRFARSNIDARRFFERFGFELVAPDARDGVPAEEYDAMYMQRRL